MLRCGISFRNWTISMNFHIQIWFTHGCRSESSDNILTTILRGQKNEKTKKVKWRGKDGISFALPAAIYMMVFIGYLWSRTDFKFQKCRVYSFAQPQNQVFVGLKNYIELFTSGNSILTKSIVNTLIFTVDLFSSSLLSVSHWHCYSIRNLPDVLSSEVWQWSPGCFR